MKLAKLGLPEHQVMKFVLGIFLMNEGKSNLLKIIFRKYEITFVHFVNHVIPLEFGNK